MPISFRKRRGYSLAIQDHLIESEQAERLNEVLSGSDLHLVSNAGHMVTYSDGGGFAETIDNPNIRSSVMGPMMSSLPSERHAAELMLLSVVDAWPPH
ncbi:hypothetical protein ABIA85_010037, partial [Bradyrhizobium sp. LA6.10]